MSKPLDGITVLDFSRVLAAPFATQTLAELGATVIKIERPGTGDETRSFEPKYPAGESGYFFAFNRGKKSMTLDLKSARGQQIARDLAAGADIVIENFLPGTMDKMGLGYHALSAVNPRLVYVATTGFGQTGPSRDERGYDTIFQALSGIMASTGHPDGPPAKAGIPVSDLTSGLWVVIAALTGLAGRTAHGIGSYTDVSMMDAQIALSALSAARIFALDEDPTRTGTEHPGRVPSAAFECADHQWVHISVSDQHWSSLCDALALEALAGDSALTRNTGRLEHRERIMAALREAFASIPRSEAVTRLKNVGVPVGEILSVRQALATDHAVARELVGTFDHPTEGPVRALRTPLRIDGFDSPGVGVPPLLGADTDDVLTHALSLSDTTIAQLRSDGVI